MPGGAVVNNRVCHVAKLPRYHTKSRADQEIEKINALRKAQGHHGTLGRRALKCGHCDDGWHIVTASARKDWAKSKSNNGKVKR